MTGQRESSEATSDHVAIRAAVAADAREVMRILGRGPGVETLLNRLGHGAPLVKFAYQPTFLPHLNILALVEATVRTARAVDAVPLLLLVDDDVVGEKRFTRADIPTPVGPRYLRSGYTTRGRSDLVRYSAGADEADSNEQVVAQWERVVQTMGLRSRDRARAIASFDPAWWPDGIGSLSLKCASTLAYVSAQAGSEILVVRLSRLRDASRGALIGLWRELGLAAGVSLWTVCSACSHRIAVHGSTESCPACGSDLAIADDGLPSRLVPSAVLDDLLDYVVPGVVAGVSYAASQPHLERAARLATQHGLRFGAELLWRADLHPAEDSLGGLGSTALARSGRAGLPYWAATGDGVAGSIARALADFERRATAVTGGGKRDVSGNRFRDDAPQGVRH